MESARFAAVMRRLSAGATRRGVLGLLAGLAGLGLSQGDARRRRRKARVRAQAAGVTLCHKPGTPAEQTKVVPESAVAGHLGHGDSLGPCGGGASCAPEGLMQCSGEGFVTCDDGQFVYRACAPGTQCRPDQDGRVLCDIPQNP